MKQVFFVLAFCLTTIFGLKSDAVETCGYGAVCAPGYYCRGNFSTQDNGVCHPIKTFATICSIHNFFQGSVATGMIFFGCIALGLGFLIGKISYGLIIAYLIGVVLVKSPTFIVKKIGGVDVACPSIEDSFNTFSDTSCIATPISQLNTPNVYNMESSVNSLCVGYLTCIKKTCTTNATIATIIIGNDVHSLVIRNAEEIYLPPALKLFTGTTCTEDKYESECKNDVSKQFEVNCTDVVKTPRDYFLCDNTCINKSFTKDYPPYQYTNCSQIVTHETM